MKKVAILGKLETKFKAPFDDPDFDIWGFNYHKIILLIYMFIIF